jgi:class 3 adenylate cyclase/tetratricopeptide (TPR) repeat protein
MRCAHCQADNLDHHRFCEQCGARLEALCPRCGEMVRPGVKFCGMCGHRLADVRTTSFPSGRSSGPSVGPASRPVAYTPTHLAEKILQSRTAIEGERKQITVLFADVKGSLELLANRDPEEARALLDPVVEHMMEAVHRYEGTVNHVLGDGIMALFGAPLAHEDHAVRACYAALAMQEAIRHLREEVRRTHGVDVLIRVGLHSGEVVVRAIGNDLYMDYSAIGQTTHLASRMEQLAAPGSCLLTAETLRLAEGLIHVQPLGPKPVKGMPAPLEVFELVGAGPTRRRLQASVSRGLTRFVGREPEFKALHQALRRVRGGHGQVVAVIGEPGIGKSRLYHEFIHAPWTDGWLILEADAVSYGEAMAYLPVIDLLKGYAQIEAHDPPSLVRDKLVRALLTVDHALEPTLPALLTLLDVPFTQEAWQALDPSQRRQHTLESLIQVLRRESQKRPVLVVIENLQWIDTETEAFLDRLAEGLPTARLLLLVNYRPEYQPTWGEKPYCTQLHLDPLPPESAEELLQTLLGDGPDLRALKERLIRQTGGNPFFLEEIVRTLVETGELIGHTGAYRPARALTSIQVPATVQAVLAARIDRLPPEEKRLLQSAAVIGEDIPFALLQAIAEAPAEALHRGLSALQEAGFCYEAGLFPKLAYRFTHALTHEVAYGSVLQERRRLLHSRIVEAMERLSPEPLADQVEHLAHHALRGEVWDKALACYRQAGIKAAARSAHREAVACWEQALIALQRLPESRESIEQAIDLRLQLRTELWPLGDHRRISEYLQQAEDLAERLGDQRRLGLLASLMTQHFRLIDDQERAIASAQRALEHANALGDFALLIETNFRLGRAYDSLGEYRRAADFFRQNVAALVGEQRQQRFGQPGLPSVLSRAWLVLCLGELGAFHEGEAHGEEAIRIAEAVDHPFSLATAYYGVGGLYLHKGDLSKAIQALEHSLDLCETWDIQVLFPDAAAQLGYAYALAGRTAHAITLLEQAVGHPAATAPMAYHARKLTWLSEAYLLAGEIERAQARVQESFTLFRQCQERGGHQAWALRLLGEIASRQQPPATAQADIHYQQALVLAERHAMRPLQAHIYLGLGRLHCRTGRLAQARRELSAAADHYRTLEMPFWRVRAESTPAQTH